MNYEKIILELLERIKDLEVKVSMLESKNLTSDKCTKNLTQQVRDYINDCKNKAKAEGLNEIILVCNDIQKKFNVSNRAPAICTAMYDCMNIHDEVLFAPPKGKSTTVRIKYYIN